MQTRNRDVLSSNEKAELLAGLVARDPHAAEVFVERYAALLRNKISRVLGADTELADVVQDAFEAILRSAPLIQSPMALEAWLAVIAIRTAHRALRSRVRVPIPLSPDTLELLDATAATWSAVDLEGNAAEHAVARALAQLPAEDQQVLSLRYLDGLDMRQLAAACEVSVSTAKRRLARARRFLAIKAQRHFNLDG